MAQRLEVYKCNKCGNIVEVLDGGKGQMVCCNEPMVLQQENTVDAAREKHVPQIEKVPGGWRVQVGAALHPMIEEHFIEWIELVADGQSYRQFLEPGESPEAVFPVEADQITAREYCSLHGLWKAEN